MYQSEINKLKMLKYEKDLSYRKLQLKSQNEEAHTSHNFSLMWFYCLNFTYILKLFKFKTFHFR